MTRKTLTEQTARSAAGNGAWLLAAEVFGPGAGDPSASIAPTPDFEQNPSRAFI
jgi:hypothetical protein